MEVGVSSNRDKISRRSPPSTASKSGYLDAETAAIIATIFKAGWPPFPSKIEDQI